MTEKELEGKRLWEQKKQANMRRWIESANARKEMEPQILNAWNAAKRYDWSQKQFLELVQECIAGDPEQLPQYESHV
jgi:hypothetical protein